MLERLKMLLGISAEDSAQDDRLLYCIDTVSDAVTNYCNIPAVPSKLESTVVRMAAGFYVSCGFANRNADGTGSGTVGQNVTSVKRGDVTISYGSNGAAAAANGAAGGGGGVMDLLNDYKAILQRFRRFSYETGE